MFTAYCPACDKPFVAPTMGAAIVLLKAHMKKALSEPEALNYETHVEIYNMEGWDEQPLSPS